MARTYRTAQGRQVDMERLRLQNELTPAVGNMRDNARGDQLGPGGKVVQTREEMLDQYYKNTVNRKSNVADEIPTSSDSAGRAKEIEADDFVNTPTRKPAPTADPVVETPVKKRAAKKKPKVTETPVVEEPVKKSQPVPPSLKEADPIAEIVGTDDSNVDLGKADKNSGLNAGESHIKGGLAKAIAKTRDYEQRMGRGKPKRI